MYSTTKTNIFKKHSEVIALLTRLIHAKLHPQHNRFIFSLYNSDLAILYYTKIQKSVEKYCKKRKELCAKKRQSNEKNKKLFSTHSIYVVQNNIHENISIVSKRSWEL